CQSEKISFEWPVEVVQPMTIEPFNGYGNPYGDYHDVNQGTQGGFNNNMPNLSGQNLSGKDFSGFGTGNNFNAQQNYNNNYSNQNFNTGYNNNYNNNLQN